MMLSRIASRLSPTHKRKLKSWVHRSKLAYVTRFRSYDENALVSTLRRLGVVPGDVLIVHAAFSPLNGFRGSPMRIVAALGRAVGNEGTLLMPSSPYSGSTTAYLETDPVFDVRRTPSRMGIVSEMFRRQKGTTRSLNPAHPIVAAGPLAAWFVEGHEKCACSCGPDSPFDKLVDRDAKALLFDVGLKSLTFLHYLEHMVSDEVPFPLYEPEAVDANVVDFEGRETTVPVRLFAAAARSARRFEILENELRAGGMLPARRVGNTTLSVVRIRDTIDTSKRLAGRGKYFYDEAALSG